ncbi:MAG: hypothetical protein ABL982_00930 [Vicinamibacterales bacterium]
MTVLFRFLATVVSGVSALYFVFWVGGATLLLLHAPVWPASLCSLVAAAAVGRYVWRHTGMLHAGLISSIALGAFATGGIGFVGGFFGPMLFVPDANQGPLLGLFITGPLGFVLGALGGAVYWVARGRRRLETSPER